MSKHKFGTVGGADFSSIAWLAIPIFGVSSWSSKGFGGARARCQAGRCGEFVVLARRPVASVADVANP